MQGRDVDLDHHSRSLGQVNGNERSAGSVEPRFECVTCPFFFELSDRSTSYQQERKAARMLAAVARSAIVQRAAALLPWLRSGAVGVNGLSDELCKASLQRSPGATGSPPFQRFAGPFQFLGQRLLARQNRAILSGEDLARQALEGYIELNPVCAGLIGSPGRYRWSSAAAHVRGRDDVLVRVGPPE